MVNHTVSSYDCHYDGLELPRIEISLIDTDPIFALRVFPPSGIMVGESADIRRGRYFIFLDGVPDTDIVVNVIVESNQIRTDTENITITVDRFFEYRQVNVFALDDFIDENGTDTVIIRHELLECAQSGDGGVCQHNHTLESMTVTVLDNDEARVQVNQPPWSTPCVYCGSNESNSVGLELPEYEWLLPWPKCYMMFHDILCGRYCSPSWETYTVRCIFTGLEFLMLGLC